MRCAQWKLSAPPIDLIPVQAGRSDHGWAIGELYSLLRKSGTAPPRIEKEPLLAYWLRRWHDQKGIHPQESSGVPDLRPGASGGRARTDLSRARNWLQCEKDKRPVEIKLTLPPPF